MGKQKGGKDVADIDLVLKSMRPMCIYRPVDLIKLLPISESAVRASLKRLARGMVVDVINDNEKGRKRMYQTKQETLF